MSKPGTFDWLTKVVIPVSVAFAAVSGGFYLFGNIGLIGTFAVAGYDLLNRFNA